MKYLREFQTRSEYDSFVASTVDYPNVCLITEDDTVAFNPAPPPLYIEAIEDLAVKFGNTYEYSKDNVNWTSATSSTSISVAKGERVFFRASGLTVSYLKGIGSFTISNGDCNVGGNVMSMVYGADFKGKTEMTQWQFRGLFAVTSTSLSYVVDASNLFLPATTLEKCCYYDMFRNQQQLVNSPNLPATTLADSCYYDMFYGCTSLVNAPNLPATSLASRCYEGMFEGCTSLVNAPNLPATNLIDSCYNRMFYGCSSLQYIKAMFATAPSTSYTTNWTDGVSQTGTFVKNSAATWEDTFGPDAIPEGWIVELADA